MKPSTILLLLITALLSACGSAPAPDADFKALRKQLMDNITNHPLAPLLMFFLCGLLSACSIKPTAILPDGTKISVGGSIVTKSTSEASVAEAVSPNGTKVRLTYTSTGLDETAVPNAKIGADLTKGIADDTMHLGVVTQRNITQRGTVLTSTTPTGTVQSVSYPAALPVPKHP